ncbi:MAG: hypothetical protein ABMA26_19485 [Limisphaerales bacterium]
MLPQIHIFDLILVACLTAGLLMAIRKQVRRVVRSKVGAVASFLVLTLVVGLLALHVWAQMRPLAPVVEVRRHFRAEERAHYRKQMDGENALAVGLKLPDDFINQIGSLEFIPLDHVRPKPVQEADIREIKRLLAWSSWFPEMPKELIIVPDWRGEGETSVRADFNWRLHRQRQIVFEKRDGSWVIRSTRHLRACGEEPTDFVSRSKAAFPIDFSGYHSTF